MTRASGEIFRAHRLILARNSEFFARILMSDFKEKKEARIKLNFADPGKTFTEIFPIFICFSFFLFFSILFHHHFSQKMFSL